MSRQAKSQILGRWAALIRDEADELEIVFGSGSRSVVVNVRSDGTVGGYGGGNAMKRALLAMEGVEILLEGKAPTDRFYY